MSLMTRYLTPFHQHKTTWHIVILLVIYLTIAIFITIKTQGKPGMPFWEDKAEHYNAYLQGYNLLHYDFFKSYGLVDDSTGKEPADHPFAYIHGGALFPRLFTFSLLYLGIEDIYYQSLIFAVLLAIWVPLAYLALLRLFNVHIAFWVTFLLATDYQGTLTNAFNLYRGWPIVIFFYMLWASVRLDFNKRRYGQYLHLAMAIFIAVSYEFPFAGFCLLISAYVIYWNSRSFIKTILVLSIPTLVTLILFAIQVTLYLGGVRDLISYAITSIGYRSGQIALTQDIESFYASRRLVFWQYANKPVGTVIDFIPNMAKWFVEKNGLMLAVLVLVTTLFVFGWYLYYGLKRKPMPKTNFNPTYFLLFAVFSMLVLTLMFPAYMVLYNRQWSPMAVFFIYLSVPLFLIWIQRLFGLKPILVASVFLFFWGVIQIQNYDRRLPAPDLLLEKLHSNYVGASFGTPLDFRLYAYQPLWYAVRSDVAFIDVFPVTPPKLPCHIQNYICYDSQSSYYSQRERPPDYLLVGDIQIGSLPERLEHLLAIPGVTVDLSYNDFLILKLNDVELLNDHPENSALYVPINGRFNQNSVKEGLPVISASGEEIRLKPGDLVLAGNQLVRLAESDKLTYLAGHEDQSILVENLGVWDSHRRARSGVLAIFHEGRWTMDSTAPSPVNLNFDFSVSNESDPIPGWWIRPGSAEYEVIHLQDETGPFVRIQALQDTPYLVIGQSPPTDLGNVSVSLVAQIRANTSSGRQVLGMVDMASEKNQEYSTESTLNNQWNILGIPWVQVQVSPDDNYAVGVFDVKAGDWFDVRELSVYIGPPSQ